MVDLDAAVADVVFDGVGVPAEPAGDFFLCAALGVQGVAGCDPVGVTNDEVFVHTEVVVGVWVCRGKDCADLPDVVAALEVRVVSMGVVTEHCEGFVVRNSEHGGAGQD